ncbi:hypothetical protein NP493_1428g00055 [Ridgeia piscesae]|uniref:Uncharacterized protein n=1 Tax=Ridgeia piscesae TaxID=27915 RepID=A0AAD9K430_RIDPI|nr:hypothetical protein NP493_1428g00055 [Ridgeia piscesae]
MLLIDPKKRARTLHRCEDPVQKRPAPATNKDNRVGPFGDQDGNVTNPVKTTSEDTKEDGPLETPVTKFKSKLMAKDVPSVSTIRAPKGPSNLVKTEHLATAKLPRSSATEPSGAESINPPPKKNTTKDLSSKISPPRVINKLTSGVKAVSQGDEKTDVQKDAKPAPRMPVKPTTYAKVPSKMADTKKKTNQIVEPSVSTDGLPTDNISNTGTESTEVTETDAVPHTRKRWSHSVPGPYKSMAPTVNRKRFSSTASAATIAKQSELIVTKETFFDAFEKVPLITMTSFAELPKRMLYIQRILANRRSLPSFVIESAPVRGSHSERAPSPKPQRTGRRQHD